MTYLVVVMLQIREGNNFLTSNAAGSIVSLHKYHPSLPAPPLPLFHLLIPGVLQAVYDTAQPDVEQPDLSVQVVDFLFQ